jgi:hypothetical protein
MSSDKKRKPDFRKWGNKYLKDGGLPITSRPPNDKYRENYDQIDWHKDK